MSRSGNGKPGFSYESQDAFNWDEYLRETGGTAAPARCFKQREAPPKNEFNPGMKLEARDPRNLTSICIASVISTIGPRLRLRLDGSDDKSDFYRIVDSTDLHPNGYCEHKGELLQPPLGFMGNPSSWNTFLKRTKSTASFAPASFFKPEPPTPTANFFEVGMKLEAVDRKNAQLICPATVGAIDKDQIHVEFDGWKGAFDYWCRYDSREIFPVGWCQNGRHPLQPPGNRPAPPKNRVRSSNSEEETREKSPTPPIERPINHVNNIDGEKCVIFVRKDCDCGPYIDKEQLQHHLNFKKIGPVVITSGLHTAVQSMVNSAKHQRTMFSRIRDGNGRVIININYGDKVHSKRLPPIETNDALWSFLKEFLQDLDACPRLFSPDGNGECEKCSNAMTSEKKANFPTGGIKKSQPSSPATAESLIKSVPNEPVNRDHRRHLEENGTSGEVKKMRLSVGERDKIKSEKRRSSGANSNGGTSRNSLNSSISSEIHQASRVTEMRPLSHDPANWTTDEVVRHVVDTDPALTSVTDLFRTHEIDGKALMLLNSDMMMKYMGLKLGPALKLSNIIEKLKQRK